jgi:hypothetical protein
MILQEEIINTIFEYYNFDSYLEIGVRNPADTFDKIKSTIKHSVDPNPYRNYTYNVTSDVFFEKYVNMKYDVIFIDGMHTEEQVYKDVKNSINHLNESGFIIIHDCNPKNKWLTRSWEEYLSKPGGWNGTVYKAFLRLKKELKEWSCFVVNENQGCGVLTRNHIIKNELIECNIDDITWEEFEKNRNLLLQLISFEYYKTLLKNAR